MASSSRRSASKSASNTGSDGYIAARIGERHVGFQTQPRRGVVQRDDALGLLDGGDDNLGPSALGRVSLRGQQPRDAVGRKPAQPHRQEPLTGRYAHDGPTR